MTKIVDRENFAPLLSLCIPTYNRPHEFRRLVEQLCQQDRINEVELVIRDDSSNSDTFKVVNEVLIPAGIDVKYSQGEKIGVDSANLLLIENAVGKYVWSFSDDDEMRPSALAHVISLLESDRNIRYIWANFDYQTEGRSVVDTTCRYFVSGDDVINTLGVNIGLISTHIFHRETALQVIELARKNLYGFGFAGLIPIFHIITSPGRFYLLGKSYILCNPTPHEEIFMVVNRNGDVDNKGFEVYGVHFSSVVSLFKGRFSNKAVRELLSKNLASLWRGMLVGWVGGWDTPKGKRLKMLKIYWKFPGCWIALSLFCLPRQVVKKLYYIYSIFFKQRKYIFNERLKQWLIK